MQKRASALLGISIFFGLTMVLLSARFTAATDASTSDATISGTVKSDDGRALRGAVGDGHLRKPKHQSFHGSNRTIRNLWPQTRQLQRIGYLLGIRTQTECQRPIRES